MKHTFYIALFGILSTSAAAQPRYGFIDVPMCWTVGAVDSSITQVLFFSAPSPVPIVQAYVNAQGDTITVAGGTLAYGYCGCCGDAGGGGVDDDWRFYNIPTDQGTYSDSLYRLGVTVVRDFAEPGALFHVAIDSLGIIAGFRGNSTRPVQDRNIHWLVTDTTLIQRTEKGEFRIDLVYHTEQSIWHWRVNNDTAFAYNANSQAWPTVEGPLPNALSLNEDKMNRIWYFRDTTGNPDTAFGRIIVAHRNNVLTTDTVAYLSDISDVTLTPYHINWYYENTGTSTVDSLTVVNTGATTFTANTSSTEIVGFTENDSTITYNGGLGIKARITYSVAFQATNNLNLYKWFIVINDTPINGGQGGAALTAIAAAGAGNNRTGIVSIGSSSIVSLNNGDVIKLKVLQTPFGGTSYVIPRNVSVSIDRL